MFFGLLVFANTFVNFVGCFLLSGTQVDEFAQVDELNRKLFTYFICDAVEDSACKRLLR